MVAEVKRKQEKREKKKKKREKEKKREKQRLEALAAAAEENSVLETEVKAGGCGVGVLQCEGCDGPGLILLRWQSNVSWLFLTQPSCSRVGFVG